MALPVSYDLVPIRGTYVYLDGTPVSGKLTFVSNTVLTAPADDITIIPKPIEKVLDANGHFETAIPATDDPDIVPEGFTYTVTEGWAGGRTYTMQIPVAAKTNGIDLSEIAPVSQPSNPPNTFVQLSQYAELEAEVASRTRVLMVPEGEEPPPGTPAGTLIAYYTP